MAGQLLGGSLSGRSGFKIVGTAVEVEQALQMFACEPADPVVIAVNLKDGPRSGLPFCDNCEGHPGTRTVVLLDSIDDHLVLNAFRSGARGLFLPLRICQDVAQCLLAVHQGQILADAVQMQVVSRLWNRRRQGKPRARKRITGSANAKKKFWPVLPLDLPTARLPSSSGSANIPSRIIYSRLCDKVGTLRSDRVDAICSGRARIWPTPQFVSTASGRPSLRPNPQVWQARLCFCFLFRAHSSFLFRSAGWAGRMKLTRINKIS